MQVKVRDRKKEIERQTERERGRVREVAVKHSKRSHIQVIFSNKVNYFLLCVRFIDGVKESESGRNLGHS